MDRICIQKGTRILEIGCGSGIQSNFLSEKSSYVISSDIALKQAEFGKLCIVKCSGEYLPFKKGFFDIVYSSNVLEHIKNRSMALREMRHVLEKEGILVCVVPTSMWKILQLVLYYPKKIYNFIRRRMKHKKLQFYNNINIKQNQRWEAALLKHLMPSVHGEFKGNREEIVSYRKKNWVNLLETNGFYVYRIEKLLLYAPLDMIDPKLRAKNITIFPPSLKLEKITGLCSSVALFAKRRELNCSCKGGAVTPRN